MWCPVQWAFQLFRAEKIHPGKMSYFYILHIIIGSGFGFDHPFFCGWKWDSSISLVFLKGLVRACELNNYPHSDIEWNWMQFVCGIQFSTIFFSFVDFSSSNYPLPITSFRPSTSATPSTGTPWRTSSENGSMEQINEINFLSNTLNNKFDCV